jgi:hypothetical protein
MTDIMGISSSKKGKEMTYRHPNISLSGKTISCHMDMGKPPYIEVNILRMGDMFLFLCYT